LEELQGAVREIEKEMKDLFLSLQLDDGMALIGEGLQL
jgi:hypothetical protein